MLCLALLCIPEMTWCQGSCASDTDCDSDGKFPCCSRFGYCGDGPGYCEVEEVTEVVTEAPEVPEEEFGCFLPPQYELVGGDLPPHAGGGGVVPDSPTPTSCQTRCRDNPLCLWFTYEAESNLCFLKSNRGFLRRRSEVII